MTINGQIDGRGWNADSIAKPVRYGTAVGACPEPTAIPTNPSSQGRCRVAAIAHPGAGDWAVKGKYANTISTAPTSNPPQYRIAGVILTSTKSVRRLRPSKIRMPKIVVTANTPVMKLKEPGTGDLLFSRLS